MNNKRSSTLVFTIIAFIICIICFILYGPMLQHRVDNIKEKKINELLDQINDLYIANEYIQQEYDKLEMEQDKLHNSAEANRQKIDELRAEFRGIKGEVEREPGMLNESGDAQLMPELVSTTPHDKFIELANDYGLDASTIWEVENYYGIKEGVVLCITIAETSGGNRGYGKQNIGSVGSTDRGDRPTYALMETGLEGIGKTLTNKYLGKHQTLGCLSNAGHCKEGVTARYATSEGNWERNMVSCLSSIYGEIDPSSFSIRR